MVENIKAVNNPLTIIAIFAAISEVALIYAFTKCPPELQATFMWFVMGFPTLLLLLFFGVLIFRHRVLYAPSDFKNEENFIALMRNVTKTVSLDLDEVNKILEVSKTQIINEAVQQVGIAGDQERKRLSAIVNQKIEVAQAQVTSVKDNFENEGFSPPFYMTTLKIFILNTIRGQKLTIKQIDGEMPVALSFSHLEKIIVELIKMGFIENKDGLISLTDKGRHYAAMYKNDVSKNIPDLKSS